MNDSPNLLFINTARNLPTITRHCNQFNFPGKRVSPACSLSLFNRLDEGHTIDFMQRRLSFKNQTQCRLPQRA